MSVLQTLREAAEGRQDAVGEAVAHWSTSTIVGLHWESVAAGGTGFVGTSPIAGKIELEGLLFGPQKVPAGEDPHRFRLGVATTVPGSELVLAAEVQLFPRASQAVDFPADVVVAWGDAGLFLPVSTLINMMGRRIVGRWYNGATVAGDAYVGIVLHEVVGGEGGPAGGFLLGEPVLER